MGVSLVERWSPKYALNNAIEDMKESGLDGLKKHLTSNALKSIESYESVSSIPGASLISAVVVGGDALAVLLDKLSECEWTIIEVMKGSETSRAIVGFNYEDSVVGTVDLTLIKEDKSWKIDNLSKPKFEKVTLSQEDVDQSAE